VEKELKDTNFEKNTDSPIYFSSALLSAGHFAVYPGNMSLLTYLFPIYTWSFKKTWSF